MNIIIAGDGKVGMTLTRQLSSEGHNITLIDSNPAVLERSMDQFDVMTVCGNCATMNILESAGIKDSNLLIAATSKDEINMLCCMTAHAMNPDLHTIARVRNPEYLRQLNAMKDLFSLSLAVNPEKLAAEEISRILTIPGFLKRDTLARGYIQIVELKVEKGTALCDTSLYNLNNSMNCHFLIFSVLRDGEYVTPGGDYVLQAGDHIWVAAPTTELELFLYKANIHKRKIKNVIICGGGRIAYYLTKQLLKVQVRVKIIESDKTRCDELAEILPDSVDVICGDASSESLLKENGLETCDGLITLTGMDEMNVIISMYGNYCKVPAIVTKLGHMDHDRVLDDLQIGSIIYPKYTCSSQIIRYVRAIQNQSGAALSVHSIADGNIEAIEFEVDASTKYQNIPLKDLKIKKNILIASINRERSAIIPDGDSTFSEGNIVVIISSRDEVIYQLNDIFA